MAKKKDVLLNHDYDGIQELDNDLPSWWLWLFYFTIFWAAIYLLHYHVLGTGKSIIVKYEQSMNPNWSEPVEDTHGLGLRYHSPYFDKKVDVTPRVKKQFAQYIGPEIGFSELVKEAMARADADGLAKLQAAFPDLYADLTTHGGPVTPKATVAPTAAPAEEKDYERLTDESALASGKNIYIQNCATCHGQGGEGGVGPNLTDAHWIHGAGMNNMMTIIKNGVPAKGMISWRPILSERQMQEVSSYMMTLYDTNPPNPKKPQGEEVDMSEYVN